MRILFISNLYPPHDMGGMEIRCRETVEHLEKRGHLCYILTSRWGVDSKVQLPDEADVTRSLYLQADVNYYQPLDFFRKRPRQEEANLKALRATITRFQPDVIFIWGMWLLSRRLAYVVEQLRPGKVAYAIAGYWLMEPDAHEAYWQRPGRTVTAKLVMALPRFWALRTLANERKQYPLQLAEAACVSHYVRDKLNKTGVLPHGARVIYNGVDPTPFLEAAHQRRPQPENRLRLVYTGSLIASKGVITAVEALGLLQQQGKADGLHLTLVGSGHPDYEAHLRARVEALDIGERVTFYGRVPREKIAGILAEQDVFLFTSVYEEPIARTVMEAMAAELTVIATGVGGQAEMLEDGVNALTFAPEDHHMLAKHILHLKEDSTLCQRLATAGQQSVLQHFTLARMVDEMEVWLQEIAV